MITFNTQGEINTWVDLVKIALKEYAKRENNPTTAADYAVRSADVILTATRNRTPQEG